MRLTGLAGFTLGAFLTGLLFTGSTFASTTLEREFHYSKDRFTLQRSGEATLVEVRGAERELAEGRPDLPWIGEVIEVPDEYRVTGVQVVSMETAPLAEHTRMPSAIVPHPGLGPIDRSAPNPEYFERSGFQPESQAKLGLQGWQRGRNLVYVQVCPVRWEPTSGRLERVTALRVRLTLEPGFEPKIPRLRVVPEWESDGGAASPRTSTAPEAAGDPRRPQPFKATQIPSVLGSPVAYLIITNDAMASEFQRLADWKTQTGLPAVVRTISFIRQQYPAGTDDADRIRMFIRDAYSRWGTKWVLLGGDTDILPVRYAYTTYYGGESIPSDLYYSSLDGNWNADGDDLYGEGWKGVEDPGDQCDLLPEVWVGRAPVTTVAQATHFVNRTLLYIKTSPGDYENRALFFAEVLFPQPWTPPQPTTLDGAELVEEVLPFVRMNPSIRYTRLYQTYYSTRWPAGSFPETRRAVLDSLNIGYNLAMHVGHGYRNVMSVADANIDNTDVMGLTNGNRLSNVYATNCTSNAIDFQCIGEAFLLAPNGGAVTNIGSSRFDFPSIGRQYEKEYFRLVYDDSITAVGEAAGRQKTPFAGSATTDGLHRWTQMTMLLLGDPELRIYTGLPRTLAVTHPASVALNDTAIAVHVAIGGVPLPYAKVALYKAGDEFRVATTYGSGDVTIPFRPDNLGSLTLTVTAYDARPYQATLTLTPASPPVLGDLTPVLDDDNVNGTVGNSNAVADAGETIDLRIPVKNSGGTSAPSVNGTLTTTDGLVSILVSAVNYGTIAAGATSNPAVGFRISLPFTLPDQREVPLKLTLIDGSARSTVENLQITVRAPEFFHLSHTVADGGGNSNGRPDSGETVGYSIRLRNLGTGGAATVTAKLRSVDGFATVTDSTSSWGSLAPNEEKVGDPFQFSLSSASAMLELRLSNEYGLLSVQRIDVQYPDSTMDLFLAGYASSIDVRWTKTPSDDLRGYNVYRSLASGGPYTKVNAMPTDRTAYYLDSNLAPLTPYYYKVTAVDSSGNESTLSSFAKGSTTPGYHSGFPIPMGTTSVASVAVEHLYASYPLDIASSAGVIYLWHPDGSAPVDADNSGSTYGDFTTLGSRYDAGPTIADLDNDGSKEVIAACWNPDVNGPANPRLYVFNQSGQIRANFPVVTYDPVFSGVAVGDLNNDGSKEMVFGSNGTKVYAYRANGQEWRDGDGNPSTTGIFKVVNGSPNYGTPTLVDVDRNGTLDIVFASFLGTLYAWRPDGTNLPGFPITLGYRVTGSVAAGYLDGAGDTELDLVIATGDYHSNPDTSKRDSLYVIRANGVRKTGWPIAVQGSVTGRTPSPALADMNNDGYLDVVYAGTDGLLRVLNRNGQPIAPLDGVRYSLYTGAASESSPVIADISGDGRNDIIVGDDLGYLQGINGATGGVLPGFPIIIGSEVKGTPAVCDCDGDGKTEIVVTTFDGNTYVWDYEAPFSPTIPVPWPQFHHDAARTGYYSNPTFVDAPPAIIPAGVELAPALPNPAGTRARIAYAVPSDRAGQPLELAVYDVFGRQIQVLERGTARPGRFSASWNLRNGAGSRVGAGVYFMRLSIGAERAAQKLVVIK